MTPDDVSGLVDQKAYGSGWRAVWNDQRDARLRALWPQKEIGDIAEAMGLTYHAVKARAQVIGLEPKRRERRWNAAAIVDLRAKWADPEWSIRAMAEGYGCTHSAIIGLAHREKFGPRKAPKTAAAKFQAARRRMSPAPVKPAKKTPLKATTHFEPNRARERRDAMREKNLATIVDDALWRLPPGGGVTLVDVQRPQCRWPCGEPADIEAFRFCGAAVACEGASYCAEHGALAFNPNAWTGERRGRRAGARA